MKEDYFKYIFQKKKIRKENKTKTKIKRTSKRNAYADPGEEEK